MAGRSLGQGLVLALFGIGGLFLVIEFIALIAGTVAIEIAAQGRRQ